MLSREQYDQFRVAAVDPATIRCSEVEATLKKLAAASNGRIKVEKYADSFLGRPIHLVTVGTGPRRVLLWSQMHGDEPTHTAVLLDILSYLIRTPAEPLADDLLAGATLMMLPMLNPDGAEVVTRQNAQGIDINRDARRKATPEARALRRAVETLKADFGFNLHNQNARTTVGTPPRPAAVSVLAPPPDRARTETPAMRRGKQICSCFVEAVRPYADGMISRYDDTFEPRAFGDTTQAFGTATMLVEAGGWPERDYEPLTRLHFHGLLQTLHAIATDRYQQADISVYESLPESNSTRPTDCIIRDANVIDGRSGNGAYKADLTINQAPGERLDVASRRDGKLEEIGDLERVRGRMTIDAGEMLVLPGRVAYVNGFTPAAAMNGNAFDEQLAAGVTTVVGSVDIGDRASLEKMAAIGQLPLNVGFVAQLGDSRALSPGELVERVLAAVARGVLAIVGDRVDGSVRQYCDWFGVSLLKPEQLISPVAESYNALAGDNWKLCELLGLSETRGHVDLRCHADLAFFAFEGTPDAALAPNWQRLARVMVSGETVWENGKQTGRNPGVLLRGR